MLSPYAIFDMDGTLVDSMPAWRRLAPDFLLSQGIEPPQNLRKIMEPMTMLQSAEYFVSLGVKFSPSQIIQLENDHMAMQYRTTIELREGARPYLELLSDRGVRMCVATATDGALAQECLQRLGIRTYFSFILSCEDVGAGKHSPLIFLEAARRLGASPAQCSVYEDAAFALSTAAKAGFDPIGVYDPASGEENAQALSQIARHMIWDYSQECSLLLQGCAQ